jgi:imidazolonepropionase-like amidohydrolase
MVKYGIPVELALISAASGNTEMFHLGNLGQLKKDFKADIIAVEGNPLDDI